MLSIISQSGMDIQTVIKILAAMVIILFYSKCRLFKVGTATLTSDDKDYKTAISDYQRLEKATSREYEKEKFQRC